MRKVVPAADPDAYVDALSGWQRECVERLRAAVRRGKPTEEVIKWGNLVYFANGPVAVIRADETRVLFGFWRGQRLIEIEPRLKPGGKYEMATMVIDEGSAISAAKATRLMRAAVSLNEKLGDPTKAAPKRKARAS
jgi:hypothetical protein